jgi:flagellin
VPGGPSIQEELVGLRINQNVMAMNAYRNLTTSENQLSKSLERLSSGFRINRAADDAAGLVISEGLRSQVNGLKMATRNAQDGVSVVQTAEGALTETHSILQRMRELAVQAASTGSSDQPSRDAAQVEVGQLQEELDRIASTTQFGAQILLDGSYGVTAGKLTGTGQAGVTADATHSDFQIAVNGGTLRTVSIAPNTYAASNAGATALKTDLTNQVTAALAGAGDDFTAVAVDVKLQNGNLVVSFATTQPGGSVQVAAGSSNDILASLGVAANTASASGSGGVFQVGSGVSVNDKINISIGAVDSATLGVDSTVVNVATNSSTANLTAIDSAITTVSTLRGNLGAYQNRFEHTIANLSVTTENLSASESRIRDTDMAAEMMSFTRAQILQQAGTAMLAQANAVPQSVLQLLK